MSKTLTITPGLNDMGALILSALLVGTIAPQRASAASPPPQIAPDLLTQLILETAPTATAPALAPGIPQATGLENEHFSQQPIAADTTSQTTEQPTSTPNITIPLPAQQIAQTVEVKEETPAFGQAGTQRWYLQGGFATDLDDASFFLAGGGLSHFFHDGHSVNLELNGLSVNQPGDDALGATLTFLMRSHWIRGENWSLYVDGGAGIIFTTDNVPAAGSSFNFTPQVGGGASFAINDTQRLMTGLRWYHISNADTFESNPGLDTVFGYVGINFPL